MFIPFVPNVSKIINKTVIYSDYIIPIENFDTHINIVIIDNIKSFSYKRHIEKICSTNSDELYHSIQFSAAKNQLIFYMCSKLDLDDYHKWVEDEYLDMATVSTSYFQNLIKETLENKISHNKISLWGFYKKIKNYHDDAKTRIRCLEDKLYNTIKKEYKNLKEIYRYRTNFTQDSRGTHLQIVIIVNKRCDNINLNINKGSNGLLCISDSFGFAKYGIDCNEFFNKCYSVVDEIYNFYDDYNKIIELIPKRISFGNFFEASIHYDINWFYIILGCPSISTVEIMLDDDIFKTKNLNYSVFKLIENKEKELFKKIEIYNEEIKDISFIFSLKSNHIKKDKIYSFFTFLARPLPTY